MSTAAKTPNYNLSQVAGSDIPDWITDYTSDMSKIDDALKGNADDIATVRPDEFSEESTYAAGDYCIKDNVIYKAKTAVEAGAFDISDWTATTIFDELSGLNQKIITKVYTQSVTADAGEPTYFRYSVPSGYTPISASVTNSLWWQATPSYNGYIFLLNTDKVSKSEEISVVVAFAKQN